MATHFGKNDDENDDKQDIDNQENDRESTRLSEGEGQTRTIK
jgi:hypothetical protein